jgi:hypothetical protein
MFASRPFETFPAAAIGVPGYGVIVLSGEATVTGRGGTVTLKQGEGTMLFAEGKTRRAAAWPANRMKRAVALSPRA